jgi:hypothetical protein
MVCLISSSVLFVLPDIHSFHVYQSLLHLHVTSDVESILDSLDCLYFHPIIYECVCKSFRTGCLERELQIVQFSATRYSCIGILWVSIVTFAAITLRVASQRVFIVGSIYFVIDSVRKLLDTHSYFLFWNSKWISTCYHMRTFRYI